MERKYSGQTFTGIHDIRGTKPLAIGFYFNGIGRRDPSKENWETSSYFSFFFILKNIRTFLKIYLSMVLEHFFFWCILWMVRAHFVFLFFISSRAFD